MGQPSPQLEARARSAAGRGPRRAPRLELGPRAVLGLGLVAAGLVAAAAGLDLGDPGDAVRARAARAAEAESELVRLDFERRLTRRDPLAAPLGAVLAVPLPVPGAATAPGDVRDPGAAPAVSPLKGNEPVISTGPGAFETLLRAALAAAVGGETESALALLADALASRTEAARSEDVAEAYLRGLSWADHLGRADEALAFRSALVALPPELTRRGIPYRVLAALAGPDDAAFSAEVHAALMAGELPRPGADGGAADAVQLDATYGLRMVGDPMLTALCDAAASRAPALDWDAAFGRAEREARAVSRWLAESAGTSIDALTPDRWTFVTPRDAGGELLCAVQRTDAALLVHATTRERLAAAMVAEHDARAAARPDGGGARTAGALPSRLCEVHVGVAPDAGDEDVLAGPEPLGASGLELVVTSSSLDAELAWERRRLLAVRTGLVGLGLLIAATAALAARTLARERRLAELRTTFVASVSHDLRTPLASISLMVDNLQRGSVATDVARGRYYASLRQETDRLRRMVEDLLDASRVERGQGPRVTRVETDVAAFLDELERALGERAALLGARTAFTREAMPPVAQLDPDAVRRAVWNLFENALRHGRVGSEPAEVRLAVRSEGDTLVVEVTDAGPGIPARHRETIFQPFERLVDRRARRGQARALADDAGTGLGLSIVRAIARAHGGDVAALEPVDGRGARLRLTVDVRALGEGGAA